MERELEELKETIYPIRPESEDDEGPQIPLLGDVAAGGMREALPSGYYTVPKAMHFLLRGRPSMFFAAKVRGESMSEIIPDGSVVLMRECFMPREDKIYLFRIDNEFSLKRFSYDPEAESPFLAYCDGSGERIYPRRGQVCFCVAEFVAILGGSNVNERHGSRVKQIAD